MHQNLDIKESGWKVFVSYTSEKGLKSRIYKELQTSTTNKQNCRSTNRPKKWSQKKRQERPVSTATSAHLCGLQRNAKQPRHCLTSAELGTILGTVSCPVAPALWGQRQQDHEFSLDYKT